MQSTLLSQLERTVLSLFYLVRKSSSQVEHWILNIYYIKHTVFFFPFESLQLAIARNVSLLTHKLQYF